MGSETQIVRMEDAPLQIIDGDRGKNYPSRTDQLDEGFCLFLNAGNVTADGFKFDNTTFITKERDELLRKGKLKRKDIVITTRGTVGNVAFYDNKVPYEHLRINSGMVIIRTDENSLYPRYTYYFLKSRSFENQVQMLRTGSAQPQLPIRDINRIKIPIPALTEQKRIANILGTLDDKIELNQRMNETLEAIARAIFKSWFVDFDPVKAKIAGEPYPLPEEIMALFPDELVESELGLIPKGWEVANVGDIYEFSYGKSLPKRKRILGQYPVYGSNGIIGTHDEKLVNGPGIVIGRKGNPGFITWAAKDFFPIDTTFYLQTNLPMLFAFYQLNYLDLPRLSADSAVPGLNRNIAYLEEIVLPKFEGLNSFTEITSPLFDKVNFNNREIEILANIRDNLLPKLLNGELLGVENDEQLE